MAVQGGRKFHEQFPTKEEVLFDDEDNHVEEGNICEHKIIFEYIRDNIIGKHLLFNGPFGKRKGLCNLSFLYGNCYHQGYPT